MEFPEVEGNDVWGVLSKPTATEPSLVRRISGVYPISTSLSLNSPLAWNDIHIGLDMNLHVSSYPCTYSSDQFWQLGRLSLPSDGHHAIITVNACNGWNLNFRGGSNGVNFNGYNK